MSKIYIGTAGWSIPKQYADEFPSAGTHLARYSKNLNCTEINSSFYRSHRFSTWAKWADSVPNDFRFSVKAHLLVYRLLPPSALSIAACASGPIIAYPAAFGCTPSKLNPAFIPPSSPTSAE